MALITSLLTGIGVGNDVSGPTSSTDNAIARFSGTTGGVLQGSSILIDDSDNITGVTSLGLSAGSYYMNSGTLSNANLLAMYTTPVQLVAALGSDQAIIVHRFFLQHEYGSAAFTGGGAIVVQYSNTANGGGTAATDQLSATILTTGANTGQMQNGQLPVSASTVYNNVGVFISNEDAVFADGDGTAIYRIWYSTIAV